jgi:signal transduction histidine kinase
LEKARDIESLLLEIAELKNQLFEANSIIDAIKEGAIDALVLGKGGRPKIYSLESSDYTYRILIEKFGEGALSISEEGLILYCNEYFARLINIPANKIIGTYFNSYVDSVGQFQQLKADLIHGPSKGEIVLNINGKKLPIYLSLTSLSPMVPGIGIVVTDLSEKRKQEEALVSYQQKLEMKVNELNQTNINLEQFIHVISHDIKEPLRKIVAYSSLVNSIKASSLDEDDLNNLKVIRKSALRLNSLVDDLVKYASSTSHIQTEEVDLNSVIAEVLDDHELLINETSARITVHPLPVIMAANVQMRQLFANLVSNAIKYSKEDVRPEVTITSDIVDCVDVHFPNKKFYKISVQDNGIGIDAIYMDKIFTIFARLHMPNEYAGNGIGLAICRKIMENHSGKIGVESFPPKGSIFHLYFPVNNEVKR